MDLDGRLLLKKWYIECTISQTSGGPFLDPFSLFAGGSDFVVFEFGPLRFCTDLLATAFHFAPGNERAVQF